MGWGGWGKCTQLKAGPRADAPTSMPRQFRLSVCRSVRRSVGPSVTRVYCIKTAEHIIKILSLSDRAIILVFRHQELLRKSHDFTPNEGAKYKGVAIFDQYAAISRKR